MLIQKHQGGSTLRTAAGEKLAKISGIVLSHPGLSLQIEGHTDSVGRLRLLLLLRSGLCAFS